MSDLLLYRHGPIRLVVHAQGVVLLNCVTKFLVAEKGRSSASTIQPRSCSSDFHLYAALKEAIRGKRFGNDEVVLKKRRSG